MKLLTFDYIVLGLLAVVIGNHVVFMVFEKLNSRRRKKNDNRSR